MAEIDDGPHGARTLHNGSTLTLISSNHILMSSLNTTYSYHLITYSSICKNIHNTSLLKPTDRPTDKASLKDAFRRLKIFCLLSMFLWFKQHKLLQPNLNHNSNSKTT